MLNGEKLDVIPSYGEIPMDVTVVRDRMPKPTGDPVRDAISHAEFFDNTTVEVGIGVRRETISRDEGHHRYRYETGAVWRESYEPTFCREAESFPINSPEDAFKYEMIDAYEPGRFDAECTTATVQTFHEAGYFVEGSVRGAWVGIYYHLARFENVLMWMAVEPQAAHALFDMTRKFSLDSARLLLGCGVDCVFTSSDLGSANSLLFSPPMFREYIYPWLKELADLCHEHGAYLHLHCHGHIQDVMDGIVDAGVDILNPVGPSGHNDLGMFKRRWGDKITLHGGISTKISNMSEAEIADHITEVISIGRVGGRFFPRTESGLPLMSEEKTRFFIETVKAQRARGYA